MVYKINIFIYISSFIIPVVFIIIIVHGFLNKVEIYNTFIEGATDGIKIVFNILPTLVGLMLAVGILRASGTLDLLGKIISPLTNAIGFPTEVVPLVFMRMVSSSAATGLLLDLFESFGTDSFIGRFISVIMGCTETIMYTMSVYFMSIKIKQTGYTLFAAVASNIAAIAVAFYVTELIFGK